MGANAQTSVPTFTAGEILTAANMNISARTGIPVFATSVERDAAFGGTGEKTLAEGQFAFLEDTDTTQYYDGSTWQAVGVAPGLVLISTTTIGTTVSSVTVSGAFSATYDNYKIIVSGGVGSTNITLRLQLGSTTTGYYLGVNRASYETGGASTEFTNNGSTFQHAGYASTGGINANIELTDPFATLRTGFTTQFGQLATTGNSYSGTGFQNSATSFTAFTFTTSTGTLTGGTIRVYGYQNS
jgi:hypothetical protein